MQGSLWGVGGVKAQPGKLTCFVQMGLICSHIPKHGLLCAGQDDWHNVCDACAVLSKGTIILASPSGS